MVRIVTALWALSAREDPPGRVWKGLRGPGHLGNEQVTTLNLKVIVVDASRNLLAIEGAVPGPINGLLMVRKSIKTHAARRKRPLAGIDGQALLVDSDSASLQAE